MLDENFVPNTKQQAAIDLAADWYRKQNKQIFKLAGYAGTGKTKVARHIIDALPIRDDQILYCAYTGKAACVMRQNEMPGKTIHSAIYDWEVIGYSKDEDTSDDDNEEDAFDDAEDEDAFEEEEKQPIFEKHLKESLPYRLIVVDEASMVGSEVAKDLLSFNIPILALGDTGQLPPVGDSFSNLLKDPDVTLDEIMRQSGNRIPLFAQKLRQGWAPSIRSFNQGNDIQVISYEQFIDKLLKGPHGEVRQERKPTSQIICATNQRRKIINNNACNVLHRTKKLCDGEKLIRKANNRKKTTLSKLPNIGQLFLANGLIGRAKNVHTQGKRYRFDFYLPAMEARFKKMYFYPNSKHSKFDYAYAITCHASQGSEWDTVVVIDDSWDDRQNPNFRSEWRYTAATRAKNKLIWVTNR